MAAPVNKRDAALGGGIAFAFAGLVLTLWGASLYGVPSKVEQHDRDIAAIFARLNAADSAKAQEAAEALKREGFQKNQDALRAALQQSGESTARALAAVGVEFADALREVHGLPPKHRRGTPP